MNARGKGSDGGGGSRTFHAPAGFRNSPDAPLAAGEVIASQYSVRRERARTDSGVLFEAWDMVLERTVVLKLAWRDPGAPSLLAEGRRCAGLGGDAAAAIYSMGHHRGVEVLVGEFLAVSSLRAQLDDGLRPSPDELVALLRRLATAVAEVHGAGFTIGDLAPEAVGTVGARRVVFGRFSLGQLAAVGPTGLCLAPEVVSGRVAPSDPTAAVAIDLYGLGCLSLELALGRSPFVGTTTDALLAAHARTPAPVPADIPAELADLLTELCAKDPDARPPSAAAVADQLEIVAERVAASRRAIRVLVVDEDGDRVRGIWSAVRRANARAQVDAARDGREAAAKFTRDRPDIVLIDARLGVLSPGMNALELVMFARGLEDTAAAAVVVFGEIGAADAALFGQFGARILPSGAQLGAAVAELVRAGAVTPRPVPPRRTVSG